VAPTGHELPLLDLSLLRLDGDDAVIGFRSKPGSRTLERVGVAEADWVTPYDWRSVPSVNLSDLASGRVNSSVLSGRIVIVALDDPAAMAIGSAPLAARVAGGLAGAIEALPRRVLWRGWLASMVLGFCLFWYLAGRLSLAGVGSRSVRGALIGLVLLYWMASVYGLAPLLQVPSLTFALCVFFVLTKLPGVVARRRARTGTEELLSRAQQVGAQAPHTLPEEVFWTRLAKRIARAHPADGVLIAELPPFSWRLRVHPNGDLTEAIIRERRRDIRRWPFIDEHGKRQVHVTQDFVLTNAPTVLAPMEASGEVEGFILLIGKDAESAFVARPELTRQLAEEAAGLVRQRRLELQRADEWRRPAGVLVQDAGERSHNLLKGARAAFQRLRLFGDVLDSAPVGLMYADAFGDVRLLSKPFRERLGEVGLTEPVVGNQDMLEGGALPLPVLLKAFADAALVPVPTLDEIAGRELSFEVLLATSGNQPRRLLLRITRLESSENSGFVGSLVELKQAQQAQSSTVIDRLPGTSDPLAIFSLSQLLVDLVESVARRTRGNVKLQTPRVMAHVLGHRRELGEALEEFLVDAVNQGEDAGPTLAIKERQYRVELTLLDLKLGVPIAALRRTLMAPSEPPPGLEPMGTFARAIENSHGSLHLRSEEGWGARLTISLVRARPRLEAKGLAPIVDLRSVERMPKKR
jgi:hypothetical protein